MKLEGQVACVTGGGSGLGRAIAVLFAREGARVAVNDLLRSSAEETVSLLEGEGHLAVEADVSDSAAVAAMFDAIDAAHDGRCDVLVNNAGVDRVAGDGHEALMESGQQLLHMSDDAFVRMVAIHLHGAFFCTKQAASRMIEQKSGSIVNVSSIAGLAGMGSAHYASAKAGMLGLTRSTARELGRLGIRVNAICPGAIDTPMTQDLPDSILRGLQIATPLGRMGTAEEIAATALYFASADSGFVTGQALSPNGGIHIA